MSLSICTNFYKVGIQLNTTVSLDLGHKELGLQREASKARD